MDLEAIGDCCEGYELRDHAMMDPIVLWNGREVHVYNRKVSSTSFSRLIKGSFIIGNTPIGCCLNGHVAYHLYLQANEPPIYLCNEVKKKCPFELTRFQRWLANSEK